MTNLKILFRSSFVLDNLLTEEASHKKVLGLDENTLEKRVNLYRDAWNKEGKVVIEGIQTITGADFREETIAAAVTDKIKGAISFPLILTAHIKLEEGCVDLLTHELIHRISIFNKTNWDYSKPLKKLLEGQNIKTDNHLIFNHVYVHAVHKAILLDFFTDKNRLNREIKQSDKFLEYKKAWQIVNKIGYKKIIDVIKVN